MKKQLKKKKKLLFSVLSLFLLPILTLAHGNTLWEHYQNAYFPSIEERAELYAEIGQDTYKGTSLQNTSLLKVLHEDSYPILGALAFPPSTVEGTSTAGWTDDGSIVRLNTQSDFVGIGTVNPSEKLTVNGNAYVASDLLVGGTFQMGDGSSTSTITGSSGNFGFSSSSPDTLVTVGGTTTTQALNVASSSVVFNNIPYNFPASQGSLNDVLSNDGNGGLSWTSTNASTTAVNITLTAGTDINSTSLPQAVMATSSQRIGLADGDSTATNTQDFFGFAVVGQNVNNGDDINVTVSGIAGGFTGLTPGAIQYLGTSTAGTITEVVPQANGQVVGIALDASRVLLMPNNAGEASGSQSTTVNSTITIDTFHATGFRPKNIVITAVCDTTSTNDEDTFGTLNYTNGSAASIYETDEWSEQTSNIGVGSTIICNSSGANNTDSTLSVVNVTNGGFTIRVDATQTGTSQDAWSIQWIATR